MGYLVKLLSNFEKINNFDDLGLTLVAYKKINVKLYYFLCYTRIPVFRIFIESWVLNCICKVIWTTKMWHIDFIFTHIYITKHNLIIIVC